MSVQKELAPVVIGLHHVAIVVASIREARVAYETHLGLTAGEPEFIADQDVNVLVMRAGDQRIELVEPAIPDSPVSKFLEKRGGGIHHLAYAVRDLEDAIRRLDEAGVQLIDRVPKIGAHGTRHAFVHPKACGGVLTELVEDSEFHAD